ncbi:hypothetical protein M407DRAFT_9419 [Tulasnella calospora MUT 4182]|uniref:Uncharacterized protein n=1 Tax=Tulasnella calospora MUT 4182 TaxID=1051891 RepID=A0A0C3LPR8_9AGAM|nr:hypothetical protein M407DRAFT_9419 [Tulasnella calospora MUT 4182]
MASTHQPIHPLTVPRRPLPAELLEQIVEELCQSPAPLSFMRGYKSGQRHRDPTLYHWVRLVDINAHAQFRRTLSQSPRRAYLASLVKSFLLDVSFTLVWRLIEDNLALVGPSVEILHVQEWPWANGRSASRQEPTSFPNLRQLSVAGARMTIPPLLKVPRNLERLILDDYHAMDVVRRLAEEAERGITRKEVTLYVFRAGTENLRSILDFWRLIRGFGVNGNNISKRLPPLRIVHIFHAQACKMAHRWIGGVGRMNDRCYCLPVPIIKDVRNWLLARIDDGLLWDMEVIPMDVWAHSVLERCPHGF